MIHILVICDDLWHPAEVIETGMADLESEICHFEYMRNPEMMLTPEIMSRYPVIINCKGNCVNSANHTPWFNAGVTEAGPKEFKDYIISGGNLISIHAGNSFCEQYISRKEECFVEPCKEFVQLLGNRFIGHPPRCKVDVHVTYPEHPIMDGVKNFSVRDEHYQIELLDKNVKILFQTKSENGGKQTGGYVKHMGKGRICVITLGHTLQVWRNKSFRRIITNAIVWCGSQG